MRKVEPTMDIHGLTLFPKTLLPHDIKLPNLTKLDGIGSPTKVLKMYVEEMNH